MTSYRVHFALVEPHVDVGVHERLVDVDALLGVDHEHLGEQVAGLTRCQIWKDRRILDDLLSEPTKILQSIFTS